MHTYLRGTVVLLLLLLVLTGCAGMGHGTPSNTSTSTISQGTSLGNVTAPNFQLVDQYGKSITLAQFKGMPVILTFFYTHCQTACPLIAEKIHSTMIELGSNAQKVAIIAVSVDPKGDTSASVMKFSQEHQLQNYTNWHYLLGSRAALTPIWSKYDVAGIPANATGMDMSLHSSFLYVIDQQGREHTLFDADFTPDQLASNLKQLLS